MENKAKFNHRDIDRKWQERWLRKRTFQTPDAPVRGRKRYVLDMFPYPSGAGLHVGHPEGYIASDILSRYYRAKGYDVLHPMGWDAFGLPAENYALETGMHPAETTAKNIARFRQQLQRFGFSYDWEREVNTTDPAYYRWTQWIFLQLFKAGLAYEAEAPINWCPKDKVGLANEEVVNGCCERCGTKVERRMLKQWFLRITKYAERLLEGLDKLDWPDHIKTLQRNWIGKSEGAEVTFTIGKKEKRIAVLIHGCPHNPGYEDDRRRHFWPSVAQALQQQGYEIIQPAMPKANKPSFESWKEEIDKHLKGHELGSESLAIGHSCGASFLVRYLGESGKKIGSLALIAPAKIRDDKTQPERDLVMEKFYNFQPEKDIADRVVVIYSRNDKEKHAKTAKFYADFFKAKVLEFPDRKHFTERDGVKELPELIDWLKEEEHRLKVYSTRPDTLFGATYIVLSPEHPLVDEITTAEHRAAVKKYQKLVAAKSDLERTALEKEKTGVFTGAYAINPVNNEKIPVWIADYVLMSYGTGAIMAVPAHDERDWEFAKKFGLPIREVIVQQFGERRTDAIRRDGAAAVIVKNGKVLVLYNTKYKQYVLVSGGYEKGETPEATIHRELREETGYTDGAIKDYLGEIEENFYVVEKSEWRHKFHKGFLVELRSERRGKTAREDYEQYELQWLAPDDAIEKLSRDKSGQEEFVRRALGHTSSCFTSEGTMRNSGEFDGFPTAEGRKKIVAWLGKQGKAKSKINYKLRDWVFSRQRYWGEPIPIVHCPDHGAVAVPEDELPLKLPEVEKYEPTGTGESPLAAMKEWVNTQCPVCGKSAKRETNTMPTWAGSSWYFYRFTDPKNSEAFASEKALKTWMPVDFYIGGAEHAVLHLLYARFWHKALFDLGHIPKEVGDEPFLKLRNQGLILGEDGEKMSKSRGNVVTPDEILDLYGADAFRCFEMFMGPLDMVKPWSTRGIVGLRRFLDRVWRISNKKPTNSRGRSTLVRLTEQTRQKVSDDIEMLRFNTAISSLMVLSAALEDESNVPKQEFGIFLRLLQPFAPHLVAEIVSTTYETRRNDEDEGGWLERINRFFTVWPQPEQTLPTEATVVEYVVQVNGMKRGQIEMPQGALKEDVVAAARQQPNVARFVSGEPKKIIFVRGRLVNFVV